jgi:hypothetical protein
MHELLKNGQEVWTEGLSLPIRVERLLGGGGQGEVYRATMDGRPVALKWYLRKTVESDPRLRHRLERAIQRGAPSDRFLWPIQIATAPGTPDFGYVMPLREERFSGLVDLMRARANPTFAALATAGFELAHHYYLLHSRGLCYRDISFGNVFFDSKTGEVRICDTDNVDENGQPGGVSGTPDFMAPEIVRGDAAPSTQTDLHSLAVLLFYILHIHHPLDGRKKAAIHSWDLPARQKLYGQEPVFIFDPEDRSNEALGRDRDPTGEGGANALAYWPLYPQFLRDLFVRAFTDGLRDPAHGRVREVEWRKAMTRLRDSILYCRCGRENFYDPDAIRSSGGKPGNCWACGRELRLPFRIKLGNHVVMLNHDTSLFPHHLNEHQLYDFSRPLALVVPHPTDPRVWGLENRGQEKWTVTLPDLTMKDVEPGRRVSLAPGIRIHFGTISGEVRA